jgi:hypothetical protein
LTLQQSLDALSIGHPTSSFWHFSEPSLTILNLIDSSPVFQAFYLWMRLGFFGGTTLFDVLAREK